MKKDPKRYVQSRDCQDISQIYIHCLRRPTSRGIIAGRLMKLWTFAMGRDGSRIALDIHLQKEIYDMTKQDIYGFSNLYRLYVSTQIHVCAHVLTQFRSLKHCYVHRIPCNSCE